MTLEITILISTIGLTAITVKDMIIQQPRLYLKMILANPTKIFFIATLLSNLMIFPLRFACNTDGEDVLSVLIAIFLGIYILYFGRWVENQRQTKFLNFN